jgi:predicted tellurium resistance membrane protein TerC
MDFGALLTWNNAAALATLALMEIVLGVDNIVFIAVVTERLPRSQQPMARRLGLAAALITRLMLLFTISWFASLTTPLFTLLGHAFSVKDLVMLFGGAFLVYKGATEIYIKTEGHEEEEIAEEVGSAKGLAGTIVTIMVMDIVFSLDSILTAVGMSNQLPIMVGAILIAIGVMIIFADPVSNFINEHPSIKILALSFLLLIGTLLVAEGFGQHVDKGYIYAAMAFSVLVELLNMRYRFNRERPTQTEAEEA